MTTIGYIYAIIDPRNPHENNILNSTFYIGITIQTIYERLEDHVSGAKRCVGNNIIKEEKIREILSDGFEPQTIPLHKTSQNNLKKLERFYISYFKTLGVKLTNISPGGDFNPMTDLPPERIEQIIEKTKATKKANFQKKIEEKCKELGIPIEEYAQWRLEQYRLYRIKWHEENIVEIREEKRKNIKEKRDTLRIQIGDEEFKKIVADERREWFNGLSEERKEEQRKKESVYCKNRRVNETLEKKIARRAKATARRHTAKQKIIDEIGIEGFRQIERQERRNRSPRNSIIKKKVGRKPRPPVIQQS